MEIVPVSSSKLNIAKQKLSFLEFTASIKKWAILHH